MRDIEPPPLDCKVGYRVNQRPEKSRLSEHDTCLHDASSLNSVGDTGFEPVTPRV